MSTTTIQRTLDPSPLSALAARVRVGARALARTDRDPAATVARLALGAMILPHGLQKLVGAFGGFGFEGTMGFLTGTMGLPAAVAFLVIAAESFGGAALILGLFGRVAALGVGAVMVGAAATSHVQHGFFMNWNGTMPSGAEGWEFHLLAAALAAVVAIRGSGALSLDRWLGRGR